MRKPITITISDPDLLTPVVVEIPRMYVKRRNLKAVCAYLARAMDEYLINTGWDIKTKP